MEVRGRQPPTIVLASTSRHRRAQLEALGIAHVAHAPIFTEDHALALPPEELAIRFARAKAESLAEAFPDALIVGGDQVAELDGRILTKPGTKDRAVEQLLSMRGRTHRLLTALALCDPRRGVTAHRLLVHEMKMRAFSAEDAVRYVDLEQPLDCAGAYKIESRGLLLFESMAGVDHSAIVGLPMTALAALLAESGVNVLAASLSPPLA